MRRAFSALSLSARSFSTSSSRAFPRHPPARAAAQSDVDIPRALREAAEAEDITLEDFQEAQLGIRAQWSVDDLVEDENDSSSAGHLHLIQQRQNLFYLRLIEHEMPKLVGEREPPKNGQGLWNVLQVPLRDLGILRGDMQPQDHDPQHDGTP